MAKEPETQVVDPAAAHQRRLDRIKTRVMLVATGFAVVYGFFVYLHPPAQECRAKGGSYNLDGTCTKLVVVPVE